MAMGRESKNKFNLKVSSSSENLEIIREFINRIAVKGGFNTEAIEQIAGQVQYTKTEQEY